MSTNRVHVHDEDAQRQPSARVLRGPPTVVQAWSASPNPPAKVFAGQASKGFLNGLPASSVWYRALNILALVLRNATGSVTCAWIPNACYSFGNIFSGKWYSRQSRHELIVANSVWDGITFCAIILLSFVPIMLSFRYVNAPDRRPTLGFSIKKLGRATAGHFAIAISVMFSFSYLFASLSEIEPRIFLFKLDCYVDIMGLLGYFTGASRAVKRIYYEETCQGRDRLAEGQSSCRRRETPKFWRAYLKNLPMISAPMVASLFVHVLSRQRIIDSGATVLTCFVAGAIIFKLAIQEAAKHYVFKKRVRSVRTMCVLVGMPTVLIDTQTRIVILGTNNTTTSSLGALGMALVEISLRAFKAVVVVWSIRRRRARVLPEELSLVPHGVPQARDQCETKRASSVLRSMARKSPGLVKTKDDFELWSRQIHGFHTAELNADMYAEYIAIGCSASILFFCGNHPCYSLLRQSHESGEVNGVVARKTSQLYMLLFQVVVEFVVDYVSIVIEMIVGIEFTHTKKLGSFLAGLFMITAVMNINISTNIYLS